MVFDPNAALEILRHHLHAAEPDLIEHLDFRIDFGQGYLFGEPRFNQVE